MTWNKKPWAAKVYEFVNIDGRFVVGRGRQRAAQVKICLLNVLKYSNPCSNPINND